VPGTLSSSMKYSRMGFEAAAAMPLLVDVCDSGRREQLRAHHGRSHRIRHRWGPVSPRGHHRLPPLVGARRLRSSGKGLEPLRAPSCWIYHRGRRHTEERTLEPPPVGDVAVLTPVDTFRAPTRSRSAAMGSALGERARW
jgi:hypothetical protein